VNQREQVGYRWGNKVCEYLVRERDIPILPLQKPYMRFIPSPRLLTYGFRLAQPKDLGRVLKLGQELALYLGTSSCRIARYFGEVLIEIPLPSHLWKELYITDMEAGGGMNVTLGYTSLMSPVKCRVNSDSVAPILVAGRIGCGKTETLRTIMWQLANQNQPDASVTADALQFVVYDPKNKFGELDRLPHLAMPILRRQNEGTMAVCWLLKQLYDRMDAGINKPRLMFCVDELIMLLSNNNLCFDGIGRLASLGREYGIHMMLATQRPDRKYMDKLSAANIGLRLIGRVSDSVESKVACGMGGVGANLLSGKGDFVAVVDSSAAHRLQIGLTPEGAIDALPKLEQPPAPIEETYDLKVLLGLRSLSQNEVEMAPFSPEELATSLTGIGIVKLKQRLRMGQPRATRLRNDWAIPMVDKLDELGYMVVRKDAA